MENRDRIKNQLEELTSDHGKSRKETWGLSVLTLLLGIISMLIFIITFFQLRGIQVSDIDFRQPPIQSFSGLIENLKNEPMTDKRFEMLEENFDSLPSNLSLNQLKDCVDLFLPENYKLNAIRLLQPKVTDNYSDGELEGFKKLFSSDNQSEVENLLSKK